jgi:tripartite-type tricarboxylate transporter receptor subunit TctC
VKDATTIYELMDKYKTPDSARQLAKIILASGEFGRPLVTPPGVPADRLKILRDAFNKSVNDPAIKKDAEKRRLEMDPATGAALESLAKEVMSAPPDVVQRVQKLLGK